MKLEAINLGFCIKLCSFVHTSNFQFQRWLCAGLYSLFVYNTQSFTLGWITPAMQSLQKRVASRLMIIYHFNRSGSHFSYYVIKTIPSDAESREDQDGSKQSL